jgi:hypothetical protein
MPSHPPTPDTYSCPSIRHPRLFQNPPRSTGVTSRECTRRCVSLYRVGGGGISSRLHTSYLK